jgi:hypothetical protein
MTLHYSTSRTLRVSRAVQSPVQIPLRPSQPYLSAIGPLDEFLIILPGVMDKTEALRLLDVFQESLGELHPVLDLDRLRKETESLYPSSEIEHRCTPSLLIDDEDFLIVIIVLSIVLTAEKEPTCSPSKKLYQIVRRKVPERVVNPGRSSLQGVALVLLQVRFAQFECLQLVVKMRLQCHRLSTTTSVTSSMPHGVCAVSPVDWQWSLDSTTSMDANMDVTFHGQE